jgi:hypothetical protein
MTEQIEETGHWADGLPLTPAERADIDLLREAGCRCLVPLMGVHRSAGKTGPRCRSCNTRAAWPDA